VPDRNLTTDLTALAASTLRTQMLADAAVGAYSKPSRPNCDLVSDLTLLWQSGTAAAGPMIAQAGLGDFDVTQLAARAARFPGQSF
jgi:hypothetical protein